MALEDKWVPGSRENKKEGKRRRDRAVCVCGYSLEFFGFVSVCCLKTKKKTGGGFSIKQINKKKG